MTREKLSFVALAVSMLYGVGFAVVGDGARTGYAVVGGVVCALAWIAVGTFGRGDPSEG